MKKKFHPLLIGFLLVTLVFAFLVLMVIVGTFEGPLLGNVVGTVPVKGDLITDSTDSVFGQSMGARELIKELERADNDPSVSVILLDINSGGGSVVAGKELMKAVRKTKKPVVAYIGEVGASSAYLIASAADEIVADKHSLTGSIGAVSLIPNYMGLMEKIGVNMTVIKGGENKAMMNPFEEFTPEQRALMEALVREAYTEFKEEVLKNRKGKLSETQFEEIADGRILNGRQARDLGLIDHVGSRELALQRAAELGGIEGKPHERVFFPSRSPFAGIFGEMGFNFGKGFILGIQSNKMQLRS